MSVCPPVRRSFSDEHGPGTFHSLGHLPRRLRENVSRKCPVFHIVHDDDDDDDHSSSFDEGSSTPVSAPPSTIRFPTSDPSSKRSSPKSSSTSTPRPTSPRPQLIRGVSAPILLQNGKPLKPSLKSSPSSPAMLIPTQMHLRARSEPSTPKNVHFPEQDLGLATVRVFSCSARPAALSNPAISNGDETETEGEDAPPTRFPFSPLPPSFNYEIDRIKSSPLPSKPSPTANLLLESLNLSSSSFSSARSASKPLLTGSILVCNLAFEKHVAIRFTLDDWQTVSEVGAHYVDSLAVPPSQFLPFPLSGDPRGRGWDRFTFTIRLEDYTPSLSTRTLWLATRYRISSAYPESGSSQYGLGGEWWDNNGGNNYRIGFRPAVATSTSSRSRPRRETVSAPIPPCMQPPMTYKEHALGLMIPSVPDKEGQRLVPLRTGKLSLCNYVPPTVRATPSISLPSADSPQTTSTTDARSLSDDDSASPASSALSTPTVSPTILPRVIIGGQPATPTYSSTEKDDDEVVTCSKPGHIADWDWSAPSKPRVEELSRQNVPVPSSEPRERQGNAPLLPDRKAVSDSNSLYDAFVTQWCFARAPSPDHHTYDGGIMT